MFSPLGTIPTAKQNINLFREENGELWLQQNQLTVALGYNKFLSLNKKKGSGLGKFLSVNGAVAKYKGKNLLNLDMLVNGILRAFIKDYRRNLFNQPSRKNLVKFDVDDFIRNAESVLQTLKERFEMYSGMDPISKEKGDLGELLVERYFKSQGFDVEKYPNAYKNGASRVDFLVTRRDGKQFFVEAKAQTALHFGGRTYTYSFPRALMDAYVSFSEKTRLPVHMAITDAVDAKIYIEDVNSLHKEAKCDGYFFPREYFSEQIDADCTYFNQKQFSKQIDIEPCAELTRLAELFSKKNADESADIDDDSTDQSFDEVETQDEPASLNPADLPIEDTPLEENQPSPAQPVENDTGFSSHCFKVNDCSVRCLWDFNNPFVVFADFFKSLGYAGTVFSAKRSLFSRVKDAGGVKRTRDNVWLAELRVLIEQVQMAINKSYYVTMKPEFHTRLAPALRDLKAHYEKITGKPAPMQPLLNTVSNMQTALDDLAASREKLNERTKALDEREKNLDEREKNLDEREAAVDEAYEIMCDFQSYFLSFEETVRNCKKKTSVTDRRQLKEDNRILFPVI